MANRLITQGSTGTHSIQRAFGDVIHKPAGYNHHERNPDFAGDKVVYLFCNPFDWLLSIFRIKERTGSWIVDHVRNCGGDWQWFEERPEITLEEFLDEDYDPIRYREHAENYLDQTEFDCLFCRYEVLKQSGIAPIAEFWGVDVPEWEYKQRISHWIDAGLSVALFQKYGDLYQWYYSLPLIKEIRNEKAKV